MSLLRKKFSAHLVKRENIMTNCVVESYENYKEEERLSTNNARRIEFLTTARIFDEVIKGKKKILDCAAGTGIYAFYLAEKGHDVTATDITPRHVQIMQKTLKKKNYHMHTDVLDATDMCIFKDETFDVVLNMGPMYHLVEEERRQKCLDECLRVLKKGGLLVTAYIPRYSVFQYVALRHKEFLKAELSKQLLETGALRHDDKNCFWTDTYYATCEEMEALYSQKGLEIVEHFAQDGVTPLLSDKVDALDAAEFKILCDNHYGICREKSILGASNHVVVIGRKK
jgi:2-polyprenyl-3-methyl-5-hydroxy-6-metoxy-1,4-benzoquinol methylase